MCSALPFELFYRNGSVIYRYLYHSARAHGDNSVSHSGQSLVMSDDYYRGACFSALTVQKRKDLLTGTVVESTCRLVAEKKSRIFCKCSCN